MAVGALSVWPFLVQAQAASAPPSCLRFRFGAWTPGLDWTAAGHPGTIDSFRVARAAQGQAWAAGVPPTPKTAAGDTVLMLYPSFWPVGVMVTFDPRALVSADTVKGLAHAFVADGRKQNPTSVATLWKVPCG